MPTPAAPTGIDRRAFMGLCSAVGLGGGRLPSALWKSAAAALVAQGTRAPQAPPKITKEMLIAAETVAGLEFTDAKRDLMLDGVNSALPAYAAIHTVALANPTRTGKDDQMVQQTRSAWPNSFRTARFIPAVEYIQANRIRTLLMQRMDEMMDPVDGFVTPSFAVGEAYQAATDFHRRRPQKFA